MKGCCSKDFPMGLEGAPVTAIQGHIRAILSYGRLYFGSIPGFDVDCSTGFPMGPCSGPIGLWWVLLYGPLFCIWYQYGIRGP